MIGSLTESAYVQLAGGGVACIDLGYPSRYTHTAAELCDVRDLSGLKDLLVEALGQIDAGFSLDRDRYEP